MERSRFFQQEKVVKARINGNLAHQGRCVNTNVTILHIF